MGLPPDRGVRHEIDLVPGTKYRKTRQGSLPKERCDAVDAFFRAKHEAGLVRESKSPHSSSTFCVRKPNGKWRLVHAFNKLNAAIIPAQTPIPRKDVLQNNKVGCTLYSALDLVDGYYRLLMRASDIPLTAVSTPSGMLWEWLVMPKRLSTRRLLIPAPSGVRQTYFDGIFVHSRAEHGRSDVENHVDHLRAVLECMRTNKLYANADKCIFGAEEIPFLGCCIGKRGLRADPAKVEAICDWPVPVNLKDLRKWLGLVNYLHKYSENYAELARSLSNLLKKDAEWCWNIEQQSTFEATMGVNASLRLNLVSSRLLRRTIQFMLLPMKYALVKFRVHLLGSKPFAIFTDHVSLRTATHSPHLSQRMTRWLSFFAEYNFEVKYKPGRQNALADALSRRPDNERELVTLLRALGGVDFKDSNVACRRGFGRDYIVIPSREHGYGRYPPSRVVIPHDEELKYRFLYQAHDVPLGGRLGRQKTYGLVSRGYWWPKLYNWVKSYVSTCESCQRVKPSQHSTVPLASLPIPSGCWQSINMDFVFGLLKDSAGNTGVVVFVKPIEQDG
ncbi:LOW QUALITY PROTEIN: Putative retroelement [Phytophthora palmivora]|uniref:Retroelement n=1 Tax=Phytophthora palmivora TaxID=4796 RepID=A0A2P4YTM6_9STRA|nr:LOW QUALITY PROTEIN: Putative retroelement [Phytophthora palmivora]